MNQVYTILAVDDEASITGFLSRILQPHGYRVLTTQNPLEVISLLAKQDIDILISDIEMPRISGLDLVATVRQEFPSVLRILLTGRSTTENLLRAINESQVFRYLEKPIDQVKLLATLREAIEHLRKLRQAERLLHSAQRRESMMREIEGEHPEILKASIEDGVYSLEVGRLLSLLKQLPESPLHALLLTEQEGR